MGQRVCCYVEDWVAPDAFTPEGVPEVGRCTRRIQLTTHSLRKRLVSTLEPIQ
jgi:hypothetical protein